MTHTRPFITLSYAQTADGRIATLKGRSEQISGPEGMEFTHTLRRDNQAIMVGIGTVLADDPLLNCRLPEGGPSPVRIILDSELKLPTNSQIAASADTYQTIVFCSKEIPNDSGGEARRRELEKLEIEVIPVPHNQDGAGRLSLPAILAELGELGFSTLFVEGGAGLITSFFAYNLVDRLCIVASPLILGRGTEAVGDLKVRELHQGRQGHTTTVRQAGNDIIWDIAFNSNLETHFTAKALYFTKPYTVALHTEQLVQHKGEQLISSHIIGISHGSESHLYRNSFPRGSSQDKISGIDPTMEYPIKYGYMNAGRTQQGEKVFAFYPHQDHFFYPRDELIHFPESANFEDIVLYPSLETAYTIVLDAAPLPGERILIIGQGMIGLLISEILADNPGVHLAALEPDSYRRRLSTQLGLHTADPSNLKGEELRSVAHSLFRGHLPDKIIHVSGSEQGLQQAIDSAAFEALIIEASWHGSHPVQLNLGENFHRRRLTVRSSQVSTLSSQLGRRWNRARRTAEVKEWLLRISPSKYVTHRFPLSRAQEAYQMLFGASDSTSDSTVGEASPSVSQDPVLQALLIPDTIAPPITAKKERKK
ncbi:MAG: dihydrofolate reductase family protein [Spirochaetaceae bacterium]|nr:dihydrofolate reductase family protein [Spirochaetaceae bacterium]MCF7950734.1 dihydrofolate reductase family protein [Spirochaetaceae bacterium]